MAKVLVIVSDEQTKTLYKSAIAFQGLEPLVASSIEEGLEFLNKNPNLILLDVMTPDIENVNLIKEIQAKTKGKVPMIIVADMKKDSELLQESFRGACDYLFKSETSVGEIIKKVRETVK